MTSNDAAPETPPDDGTTGLSTCGAVYGRVGGLIVNRLWKETPSARALRAQLRGALSREAGSVPELWDLTLDGRPGYLGDEPTRGEKAVHGALTLWALHQGSNTRPMHDTSDRPRSFASAIRIVAEGQSGDKRAEEAAIYRRFSRLRDFSCTCVRALLSLRLPRFPVTTQGLPPISSRGRTRAIARPSCAIGVASSRVPPNPTIPMWPPTSDVEASHPLFSTRNQ